MSGTCGQAEEPEVASPSPPTPFRRNGLDYEKKTVPPDYSNVPSVRDWQMSPFGNERYDLDEIQRAEKLGVKGKAELEKLKSLYGEVVEKKEEKKEKPSDECEACLQREEMERRRKGHRKLYCTSDYLYQPYGPIVVSSVSFSRPDAAKPRMYSYLGPSILSGFKYSSGTTEPKGPVPCDGIEVRSRTPDFTNVYIPYGPMGEIRLTQDQYVPMGPSNLPPL